MKLLSIPEEAAACHKAWEGKPIGTLAVHCHHCVELEPLTEPANNRIGYILRQKAESERALRLRLFRPALLPPELAAAVAERDAAWAMWKAAQAKLNAAQEELNAAREELNAAWAEWESAWAEWESARAMWKAAQEELKAAWAEWESAQAEWESAQAKVDAARAKSGLPHSAFCAAPDCPWNGRSIFPSVERP
jgi:exonuclease VII small subunit